MKHVSVQALKRLGFGTLYAAIQSNHPAAQAAMRKLGMRIEAGKLVVG